MNLHALLQTDQLILGDGSMYELLRRSPEVELDEHIAHAGLVYHPQWVKVLERVFREYIDVAVAQRRPMLTTTATWRANRERIDASAFRGRAVNRDNTRFLRAIVDSYGDPAPTLLVGGTIGPRGDAYKPEEALSIEAARQFHAYQIDDLVAGGVDFLQAATLPALTEAIGIAQFMAQTGLPYIISFVVDKSGCLLDGTRLTQAIEQIDASTVGSVPCYAVNCVHPSVLQQALEKNPGIEGRIISFSGNTSARTTAELDGLEELDTEEPASFARANQALLQAHGIRVIGGCCGTNPEHIRAIAESMPASGPGR
jgi:homocysteine S-methyltransferase